MKIIPTQKDNAELCDAKGQLAGARLAEMVTHDDACPSRRTLGGRQETKKQRDARLRAKKKETTVSKFAYQQAGLSIRKLNLHAVSQDRMIMIFLIQVIQVDTELVRQNPNSNKDNNIIFLKNYTNLIHNFKHFKSIIY